MSELIAHSNSATARLHHLENSRSFRIAWLLEEAGVPYEVIAYKRETGSLAAPAALKKIHPLGKAPILEIDGRALAESGLIIDYVVTTRAPHLAPDPAGADRWGFQYWLHYAEGSAMPPLLAALIVKKLGILGWPAEKSVRRLAGGHLDYIASQLGASPWFLGDAFSAVDIAMSFPLEAARARIGLESRHANLQALLERARARPGFAAAVSRCGENDVAR